MQRTRGVSLAKGPIAVVGLLGIIYGVSALIVKAHGFALHFPSGHVHGQIWLHLKVNGWTALLFIARGIGDSMMSTLLDSDTLLVDRGQRRLTQQDREWAVTHGDLGMVKRVRRLPSGTFLLMSDNPSISPIEATEEEINLVGRIVWVGRKI